MNSIEHVAIIMDGNGRWAERQALPRWKGHEAGARAVRRTVEAACRQELSALTLFAFSSENWKRPEREVGMLFRLCLRYLIDEKKSLLQNDIRLSAFGRRDRFSGTLRRAIEETEEATRGCRRLHLRLALDYGSRYEIVEAARTLASDACNGRLRPGDITEETISNLLGAPEIPDPDLIIRTAGERRLSNFLLWQAAYSEFYFTRTLWPDFDENDLQEALDDYHARTRKFGALPCAVASVG